jgi:hypothetical protein
MQQFSSRLLTQLRNLLGLRSKLSPTTTSMLKVLLTLDTLHRRPLGLRDRRHRHQKLTLSLSGITKDEKKYRGRHLIASKMVTTASRARSNNKESPLENHLMPRHFKILCGGLMSPVNGKTQRRRVSVCQHHKRC